jgi:hypothetical protein
LQNNTLQKPGPLASVVDPGSGAFLTPGSGSGMGRKSGSGFGMHKRDHISESLKQFFGVKILKFVADPGWKKFGSEMEKIWLRN